MFVFGIIASFALLGGLTLGIALLLDRFIVRRQASSVFRARVVSILVSAALLSLLWLLLWRVIPADGEPIGRQLANMLVIFAFCAGGAAFFNLGTLRRLRKEPQNTVEDVFG